MYRYLFATLLLLHYGFALLLPFLKGAPLLIGTAFEKLERDPVIAATCAGFVMASIVLCYFLENRGATTPKQGQVLISLITLSLAALTVYRGHTYSAILILASTAILFRQPHGERSPSRR